jgi:hypothetical protein
MGTRPRAAAVATVGALIAVAASVSGPGVSRLPLPVPAIAGHVLPATLAAPPDTALCLTVFHVACYQPAQLRRAYHLDPLLGDELDGRGRTIAIVDPSAPRTSPPTSTTSTPPSASPTRRRSP